MEYWNCYSLSHWEEKQDFVLCVSRNSPCQQCERSQSCLTLKICKIWNFSVSFSVLRKLLTFKGPDVAQFLRHFGLRLFLKPLLPTKSLPDAEHLWTGKPNLMDFPTKTIHKNGKVHTIVWILKFLCSAFCGLNYSLIQRYWFLTRSKAETKGDTGFAFIEILGAIKWFFAARVDSEVEIFLQITSL